MDRGLRRGWLRDGRGHGRARARREGLCLRDCLRPPGQGGRRRGIDDLRAARCRPGRVREFRRSAGRPGDGGVQAQGGRASRGVGEGRGQGDIQIERLDLLSAALLGRAHTDILSRVRPRRLAARDGSARREGNRRFHRAIRPADSRRRRGPAARAAGNGRFQAGRRPSRLPSARRRLALLRARRDVVRPRDKHNAAVGWLVLVLSAIR
mmetsp:Transcript_8919/g.28305  ORF Transcript_8919/g.28305 Transcript_8919/m.28305 type:complete len:209 (-) Transcript_8919:1067-1693(-)